MSSYWTPSSPTRESDYYRPNVTLNLDRPPRPGPRQPDCWRPDRSISSSPIKREELSLSPNPDLKHKVKQPKLPNPNKQPLGQRQEEIIKNPEVTNEVKAQKLRQPKLTNSIHQPFNDRKDRLSVNNSDRLNPDLDQKLFDQSQQENLKTENKVKKPKIKPPKLPNANLQPLGKRQMGVINSIMRVEEQNVQTKVNRDRQLVTIQAKSSITTSRIKLEESDEMLSTTRTPEHSPSDVNIHPERLRHILSGATTNSSATDSSRTSLLSIPADSKANISPNSPPEPSPRLRQKLDFGNRVDQCLLKMDKWADAWLSNAFSTEDPNPDTDNAWNSFEYCLSMPDLLEEGEIIEYEEVPRQALPTEGISNTNSHVHPERLALVPGAKRKRDEVDSEQEIGIDNDRDPWLEDIGRRMESVAPEERLWSSSEGSSAPRTLTDNSSWTDIRETKSAELESSSSPEKRIKVAHIPSAATLREEARRMLR